MRHHHLPNIFIFSLRHPSSDLIVSLVFILLLNFSSSSSFEANSDSRNQTSNQNGTSEIHSRSTNPSKSLLSSPLYNNNGGNYNYFGRKVGSSLFRTLGGRSAYPFRESYIAFEQPSPGPPSQQVSSYAYVSSGPQYDDYFKPSRFQPTGGDSGSGQYYPQKLQNNFPSSGYGFQQHAPPPPEPVYYPSPPHSAPPPPPQLPPLPPPVKPFLRLVKIPGELKLAVLPGVKGDDLEITCEFPMYLITVQHIYWHFIPDPASFLPPYGVFYDLRNGFLPHVSVKPVSRWKSILRIRNYSADNYGTYRCVSSAILPDEPEDQPQFSRPPPPPTHSHYQPPAYSSPLPPPPPPPLPLSPAIPTNIFLDFPYDSLELRSSESKVEAETTEGGSNSNGEKKGSFEKGDKADLMTSSSTKREGKVKFLERTRREVPQFGVFAPFFKPHYGLYRIYKEIAFRPEPFGAGSNISENVIESGKPKDGGSNSSLGNKSNNIKGNSKEDNGLKQSKRDARRKVFDRENVFVRTSGKVVF